MVVRISNVGYVQNESLKGGASSQHPKLEPVGKFAYEL
jgi:hypothetical protein